MATQSQVYTFSNQVFSTYTSGSNSFDFTLNGAFTIKYDDVAKTYAVDSSTLATTYGGSSSSVRQVLGNSFNDVSSVSAPSGLLTGDHNGVTITPGANGLFTLEFYKDVAGTYKSGSDTSNGNRDNSDYDKLTISFTDADFGKHTAGSPVNINTSITETYYTDSDGAYFQGNLTPTSGTQYTDSNSEIANITCYLTGTHFTAKHGSVAVEDLQVGDELLTVSGEYMPVIWLGSGTVDCRKQINADKAYPVCITQGAFGGGLPVRDLYVSPDHSVFVDGVMIPAFCLINGKTITQNRIETIVTYHHVELPSHQAVYAEGLPAESYLDTTPENRHFLRDNTGGHKVIEFNKQYPVCPEGTPEWQHIWDTQGYAKLTQSGPILESVKARLNMIAEELTLVKQAA